MVATISKGSTLGHMLSTGLGRDHDICMKGLILQRAGRLPYRSQALLRTGQGLLSAFENS